MLKRKESTDTREILMETAATLFAEKGFEAVSVRELAKAADVNIAMIAYYFGSKEKLFEAILEAKIPKMSVKLLKIQQTNLDAWQKLRLAIDAYINQIYDHAAFSKMIYRELSMSQRTIQHDKIVQAIAKNWHFLTGFIQEGQQKGLFRSDIDIPLTLASFFGTLMQLVNTPCLAAHLLGEKEENIIFSATYRARLSKHIKDLLGIYLLI